MKTKDLPMIDRFAELLSQDLPIPVIKERLGLRGGSAHTYLHKIRKGLGWQAQ